MDDYPDIDAELQSFFALLGEASVPTSEDVEAYEQAPAIRRDIILKAQQTTGMPLPVELYNYTADQTPPHFGDAALDTETDDSVRPIYEALQCLSDAAAYLTESPHTTFDMPDAMALECRNEAIVHILGDYDESFEEWKTAYITFINDYLKDSMPPLIFDTVEARQLFLDTESMAQAEEYAERTRRAAMRPKLSALLVEEFGEHDDMATVVQAILFAANLIVRLSADGTGSIPTDEEVDAEMQKRSSLPVEGILGADEYTVRNLGISRSHYYELARKAAGFYFDADQA